jgi:hypothetical protein
MRAIALGLEALRKVERYGMGSGAEQYVGFQALPPATPMGQAMTVEVALDLLSSEGGMSASGFGEDGWVVKAFRAAAARHHPDRGGDPTMFRRIVEARDLLAAAGP